MLYRMKNDTFYRRYEDIGYLVNKTTLRDRVVNTSAAVFIEALSRDARPLQEIVNQIKSVFVSTPPEFEDDIMAFYSILEQDGFIVSGETETQLNEKDHSFSYKMKDPVTLENKEYSRILRAEKSSQLVMSKHFQKYPHLVSLQIEITTRCNERCVHCYIPHADKTREMDIKMFEDVLEQASDMGLLNLTISGGEPMSHSRFVDIIRIAGRYDLSISILSNLTFLNDEIVSVLKESGITLIGVSLYSMSPEVHDSITQLPGSFEKTIKAIELLINNEIPLQINCPVMKENKDDVHGVLDWAANKRIHAITDTVMMARYDGSNDNLEHRLDLSEVRPIIESVLEKDGGYRTHVEHKDNRNSAPRDRSNDGLCGVGVSSMSMTVDGKFCPCAGWQSLELGDFTKDSLNDIWTNSENIKFLRSLRMSSFPECLNCEDNEFCSVCLARNANESCTSDPLELNRHFCKVAHLNHEIVDNWLAKCNH